MAEFMTELERNYRANGWAAVVAAVIDFRQQISERERIITLCKKEDAEIDQILGKALGFPWYKDDQTNFPGATEDDGVCTGAEVPVTLAIAAANRIKDQDNTIKNLQKVRDFVVEEPSEQTLGET